MIIKTNRLILRPVVESDDQDIFEYSCNPIVGTNAGWKPHETIEETREIMKMIFLNQESVFAMELNGKLVGTLGLIDDPKREYDRIKLLGYALGEPYWNQGLMTEAARAVCQYGFDVLKLDAISAYTFPFNQKSQAVLKKLGFQYEGRLRKVEKSWDNSSVLDNECFLLESSSFCR